MDNDRFFVCRWESPRAHGGRQNCKAESAGPKVFLIHMQDRAQCPAAFRLPNAMDTDWQGAVAVGATYRTTSGIGECRIVASMGSRKSYCVGTRDLVVQLIGTAPGTVACTILPPVLDEAWFVAISCPRASIDKDKAKSNGEVTMECAGAIHFMGNKEWEKVADACL